MIMTRGARLFVMAIAGILLSGPALCFAGESTIEPVVDQLMSDRGLGPVSGPGCAISVTKHDAVTFSKGYGAADIEHRAPFTPQTVSEAGSVAKQFTAAAVLMLAERGKLTLDDDIRTYLPEMPSYGAKITIADLLHHTSGIREWSSLAALRGSPRFYRKIYGMEDLLKILARQTTLNFEPGTAFEYSNSNYGLLTVIIERVSGMSAAEFGWQQLFVPLGMHDSQWRDDLRRIVPDRAIAYRRKDAGYELAMPFENVYGHGALLTTVGDLQRWNHALLKGGLSAFVTSKMLTPGRLRSGAVRSYGAGIFLETYRGHRVYRHSGRTAGYTAQLWGFPDDDVSIALLCNVQAGNVGALAAGIADASLNLPRPAARPTEDKRTPPAGRATYYRSERGILLAVSGAASERYVDIFIGKGPMKLIASETPGKLTTAEYHDALSFSDEDADHIVVQLETSEPIRFTKEANAPRPSGVLDGRYFSSELDRSYEVGRRGDTTVMTLAAADADDSVSFRLEWLNGASYLAKAETTSGSLGDYIVTFHAPTRGVPATVSMSSVAGLGGIANLVLTRRDDGAVAAKRTPGDSQ
jgi:CubicO group peptidase (beta-lactamase class C family)